MYATMQSVNNYFERTVELGSYTIAENSIAVRGTYKVGQYVRIMDSMLNDGVYKIKTFSSGAIGLDATLINENFTGYIVGLAVPPEFVALATKVTAWSHHGVSSESIPNYSVSFKAGSGAEAYAAELAKYKKQFISPYYFLNYVSVIE